MSHISNTNTTTSTTLYTTPQAAEITGFKTSTLHKLRCTGGGPKFIKFGKSVYYTMQELVKWMDEMPVFRSTSETCYRAASKKKLTQLDCN